MMSARALKLLLAQACLSLPIIGCNSDPTSLPEKFDSNSGGSSSSSTRSSNAGGSSNSSSSSSATSPTAQGGSGKTSPADAVGGSNNSSPSDSPKGGASSSSNRNALAGGSPSSNGGAKTGGSSSTSTKISAGGVPAATTSTAKPTAAGTSGGGRGGGLGGRAAAGAPTASSGAPGASGSGPAATGDCTFSVTPSVSSKIGTVGIVEWSTTLADLSSAQIVYTLDNAGSSILNKGGTAPVDLTQAKYKTLLLGLKPSSSYSFHIEAKSKSGETCTSSNFSIATKTISGAPTVTRTATKAASQAGGFIITTTGGSSGNGPAIIIDADGTVVWSASAPNSCSRAHMDYEGKNMWMMALNVMNSGGEMRYVSMDGMTSQNNVTGLSKAHHDFTIVKGGIVAAMVWSSSGTDPESDLVERSPDGTTKTAFHIGKNLYVGGPSALGGGGNTYHCNSVVYYHKDESYVIGDRNPNMYVKASRSGTPQWQFGGSCTNAPAPKCASVSWNTNHGHHLLDDGTFVFFNNGAFGSSSSPSLAIEYKLSVSGTMTATKVKEYSSSSKSHSDSLGDVQRLPNGNTLITYSNNGLIEEVDSSWAVVQTLKASAFGYAEWRESLYGPPSLNP